MTATLRPYPAYKTSGIPWLGDVPSHWEAERGKRLLMKMERPVRDVDDVVTCFRDGTVTLRKNRRTEGFTESLQEIGYQGIRVGDLVIHAMDAFAGSVGVSDSDGKGTPVYSVCRPKSNANAHYYALVVREMARNQWIAALATGIRERSTDFRYSTLAAQLLPLPPLPEQTAIVRYLDHVDRRIRRYVSAKRKLIALLEEEKQAIVNQAVTRGLDPNVRLKPTGVAWLGDVPEHWEVRRLKYVCSDAAIYGANIPATYYQAEGVRFLRTTDIADDGSLNAGGVFLPTELVDGYVLSDGDILLSRSGTVGRSFLYSAYLHGPCAYAGYLVRFVPNPVILPKFLFRFTKTAAFSSFLRTMAISSTIENVNADKYANGHLPLPPLPEQAAIVAYLDEATVDIDSAIARTRRQIELVQEYRTRLIADVVTGKLDVREAAAQLPEEPVEDDSMDEDRPLADDMDDPYDIDESAEESAMESEVTA